MTISRVRLLRALGLLGWAAFFDYLWLADAASRYVGERTGWVIPFGAIVLSVTAIGYLATVRTSHPDGRHPSLKDLGGIVALLAPVLLVIVVPAPSLGALAVSKKSSNRITATAESAEGRDGALTILDVAAASGSPEFAQVRGIKIGQPVELIGLVSDSGDGRFTISRFVASCCAADAIPYSVSVLAPDGDGGHEPDQWLKVTGTLVAGQGGAFEVSASGVEEIPEPEDQYLTQ